MTLTSAKNLLKKDTKWVSLQFTDISGRLREVVLSAEAFRDGDIIEGFPKLDGSSIEGFAGIEESDMVLSPIPETAGRVPWDETSMRFLNKVYKKAGEGRFEKDPRFAAERTEEVFAKNKLLSFFGPEIEFFIFDKVDMDIASPSSGTGYKIHSSEAPWSNDAQSIGFKKGYYPVPPMDKTADLRKSVAETLSKDFGLSIEAVHHEVATAGQAEINFKYSRLLKAADGVQLFKYAARNIASRQGKIVTFMPKPMFGDNGSGMHTNVSFWSSTGDKNVMYDPNDKYAELSQTGRYAVGGLLSHAMALSALVSPTTNSYRRLVPGYEAPTYIAWSRANRSVAARIPTYHKGKASTKRVEYRPPDPAANPYLAFSALALAMLDGIKKKIDPGDPVDANLYELSKERKTALHIKELPGSLTEAISALKSDNSFLKEAFTNELLETYMEIKEREAVNINNYPHPIELSTYFDL